MSFSRFTHFLQWRSIKSSKMKSIIRNQVMIYLWPSRIRRSFHIYNFYIKRLHEQKLLNFFKKIVKSNLVNRNAYYSLMATPLYFTIKDWESNRINLDESAKKYFREFEFIDHLRNPSVIENVANGYIDSNKLNDIDMWEFYVQKDNMITWRREDEENIGQYIYKVYVKYDDITAEDFLHVQMDVDYRREWDHTAVKLDVVDSDLFDSQQVIYWEMLWPKLFSNRDYVFVRKCFIDRKKNIILICCKSITHPKCPENKHLQRVKDYWSYMVIKPTTTFNQKGFEFSLTYFDNPGIKIPKYITNYVSQRQLPEFIKQLYNATVQYADKKSQESYKQIDPGYEYPCDKRLDDFMSDEEEIMRDNVNQQQLIAVNLIASDKEAEEDSINRKSWWSYILPF